jgi:hypothetical protein
VGFDVVTSLIWDEARGLCCNFGRQRLVS